MTSVVCDTNILISALIFPGGNPDQVVALARQKEIKLIVSLEILRGFEEVLKEKFKYTQKEVKKFIERVTNISTLVTAKEKLNFIKKKEADNRILECAVEGKVSYIISGDAKHLLPLKRYRGIKIVTATEFLKEFEEVQT